MKNFGYLSYTYMHRCAFKFVVLSLIKDEAEKEALLERAKWHDLDKSLLYTLVEKEFASESHTASSSHHMENSHLKTYLDKMEAVIDYECAGYTKWDKPRNAYDTIRELKPELMDDLLPIMEHLGIAKSYKNVSQDKNWQEFLKTQADPTDEAILDEIYQYIMHDPITAASIYKYAKENMEAHPAK